MLSLSSLNALLDKLSAAINPTILCTELFSCNLMQVEDIDDYDLEEKHLSDGILKALASDFDNLCVEGVGRSLDALMNDVYSIFHEGGQSCARDSTIRYSFI